jgi:hypothetical protein
MPTTLLRERILSKFLTWLDTGKPVTATVSGTPNVTETSAADIKTSVQLIDDAVATVAAAIVAKALAIAGTDGANARVIAVDATGQVKVISSGSPTAGPPQLVETVESWVARNGVLGASAAVNIVIMGRRSQGWTSTSLLGDVCEYLDTSQARVTTVNVGTTYYIRSSSVDDTAAGTGTRTVRIVSLSNTGAQQVTTATMNGQTPVSIGSGYTAFQWAEVATHGTVGGVSAGNITISTKSTAGNPTAAETVEYIASGGNRSLSARYRVPLGYTAYLSHWDMSAISANMDARIRATVFADDRTASGDVLHFQDTIFAPAGSHADQNMPYLKMPAGTDILVSAIPSSAPAGNRADCSFQLLLIAS